MTQQTQTTTVEDVTLEDAMQEEYVEVDEFVELGLDHDRYDKREVARGGQGVVYHYQDTLGEQDLAIKKLAVSEAEGWHTIKRLLRESRIMAELGGHPNIAGYVGFETEEVSTRTGTDTNFYLISPWVSGKTFAQEPPRKDALENIIDQAVNGLRYAHEECGVIHRDIKPSNIMVEDDVTKLIDFGVAKKLGQTTMTDSLGGVGVYNYWAPEVRTDPSKQSHESDLYALGVVAVEALRGKQFTGVVSNEHIQETFDKMTHVNGSLREKINTLLSRDPNERKYWLAEGDLITEVNQKNSEYTAVLNKTLYHGWREVNPGESVFDLVDRPDLENVEYLKSGMKNRVLEIKHKDGDSITLTSDPFEGNPKKLTFRYARGKTFTVVDGEMSVDPGEVYKECTGSIDDVVGSRIEEGNFFDRAGTALGFFGGFGATIYLAITNNPDLTLLEVGALATISGVFGSTIFGLIGSGVDYLIYKSGQRGEEVRKRSQEKSGREERRGNYEKKSRITTGDTGPG